MNIIEMKKLCKSYSGNRGIVDIDLTIKEGEIFGFIGPNGAGKSTTIRTLLNFVFPTSGSATILDKDCIKDSAEIKKNVGYVPSEVNYYSNMKAGNIIKYAASFYPGYDEDRLNKLCDIFQVEKSKKMRELSLGNKKKIAIVQSLIFKPKLLILDEPTNGLDPLMQNKLFQVLQEENKNGMTIFFSSHNLSEVQKLCTRLAIISQGKIIEVNSVASLLKNSTRIINIKTKDHINESLITLGAKSVPSNNNEYLSYVYDGCMNKLIKTLSGYNISDMKIFELSLEDTFMKFYERNEK